MANTLATNANGGMVSPTSRHQFLVDGMHCVRCIRKIQEVGHRYAEISNLKVDFHRHMVEADIEDGFDTSGFLTGIRELGFEVKPLPKDETSALTKILGKRLLARMGIAGACAGNIMLVSFADYAGAGPEIKSVLNFFAFFCFLPIITYCSWPIYKNSVSALKLKKISVDTPLAFAIILGGLISIYNLAIGREDFYFDSISMFIFLLLASRYFVFRLQSRHLSPLDVTDIFAQPYVDVVEGQVTRVAVGELKGTEKGEFLPCDGRLTSGPVDVDNSFFTGEAYPQTIGEGDLVYAGARLLSDSAVIKLTHAQIDSRISKTVEDLNRSMSERTELTTLTDKGANYLTVAVVLTSVIFMAWGFYQGAIFETLDRVLALLVIACPCALAIATPLAQSLSVKWALLKNILVKRPDALEIFGNIHNIVFDKTGTLTDSSLHVVRWSPREPSTEERKLLFSMEKDSSHPIARAIIKDIGWDDSPMPLSVTEVAGVGVKAENDGALYEVRRGQNGNSVGLYKNDSLLFEAHLEETLSQGASDVLLSLRKAGMRPYLLSGDRKESAARVGEKLGLVQGFARGEMSPEAKLDFLRTLKTEGKIAFVGDGINDSLAMSSADVSISTGSAADTTFRISDVHLLKEGLKPLIDLQFISKRFLATVKKLIAASAVYNIVFSVLALGGYIDPLVAVILMPLSSISLVSYTYFKLGRGK